MERSLLERHTVQIMDIISSHDYMTTIAFFTGVFLTVYMVTKWWKNAQHPERRYPPAVRSVPVIGSIPFLPPPDKWHSEFLVISKKLGNVFSVLLGHRYSVILVGRKAIEEALLRKSHDFASRPSFYSNHQLLNPRIKGFIDTPYTPRFKKYHHLSLNILKDFGFGQTVMENRIQIEVDELVSHLRQLNRQETNPRDVITLCVLNVISSITCGKRFDHSDPKLKALVHSVHHFVIDSMEMVPINLFAPLRFIPSVRRAIHRVQEYQKYVLDSIEEMIDDSVAGKTGTSFISSFIEAEGKEYDKEELMFIMRDLLIAGSETSENTLQWAFILMANHPEIQKRIQHDLDAVVSRDRLPSLADKAKLPYVEAAILEIYRRHTLVPMSLPRMTICDTEVGGYFIPAGASIFVNLWSCHMDPEVWGDPEIYRPERFLDQAGSIILKDRVISFSLGKRSCLGELLARQEVYLFFTGVLQNFDILPSEGNETCDYTEQISVTVGPANYKLRFIPRTID